MDSTGNRMQGFLPSYCQPPLPVRICVFPPETSSGWVPPSTFWFSFARSTHRFDRDVEENKSPRPLPGHASVHVPWSPLLLTPLALPIVVVHGSQRDGSLKSSAIVGDKEALHGQCRGEVPIGAVAAYEFRR
jgi:hypothetical protein